MRPRTFRLLVLLAVAAALAVFFFTRDTGPPDWERPLRVVVYPENADGSAAAQAYIEALSPERFDTVEAWLAGQAARYELALNKPFEFELAESIEGAPSAPGYRSVWAHLKWGWRLRVWYWTFDKQGLDPDITLIARYREVERQDGLHSLGVSGMDLALANLTTDEAVIGLNDFLLAHELLHTVGADDLYDLATGLPTYPEGYAQPDREPLYPQPKAKLMAGSIPVAPGTAVQARRLEKTVIGPETAGAIGWIKSRRSD